MGRPVPGPRHPSAHREHDQRLVVEPADALGPRDLAVAVEAGHRSSIGTADDALNLGLDAHDLLLVAGQAVGKHHERPVGAVIQVLDARRRLGTGVARRPSLRSVAVLHRCVALHRGGGGGLCPPLRTPLAERPGLHRPGHPSRLSVALLWTGVLQSPPHRVLHNDILSLITVPLFSGAIGYATNWSGVWMLFYPVHF